MGDLVRTAEIIKVFCKVDTAKWSNKLHASPDVIHDTIPSYRINYLPERVGEFLVRTTTLTLDENKNGMKKLSLKNLIEKNNEKQMELREGENAEE